MRLNLARVLLLLLTTATIARVLSFRARAQEVRAVLPTVVTIGVPTFPPAVRLARIEGAVDMKITTDGHQVTQVEVQDGPPLLAALAEKNVRTWQFSPHDPTTFTVKYEYKLVRTNTSDTSVRLNLPTDVQVSAIRQDSTHSWPNTK
jgi:hypothetical protein